VCLHDKGGQVEEFSPGLFAGALFSNRFHFGVSVMQ
jgi:hypothetical protein